MIKLISTIIILLIICSPSFSQQNIPLFTYTQDGNVIPDNRFISAIDNTLSSLPFSTVYTSSISIDSTTYNIKTGRFINWNDEPGDFDVIQFFKNDQLILTYKDADGIVKLNNPKNLYSYPFNQYSKNGYFIDVRSSDKIEFLFFIGQHYGTDLPKLIIFAVTQKEIKLIYNQTVQINSITKTENHISFVLQSNMPNDNEMPVTHTIWSYEGTLNFKNN